MKILFLARHFTYFRNFESVICTLAERGHRLHLAAEREESLGGREMVERLSTRYPGITLGWAPERQDRWTLLVMKLRLALDYLRYLEPAYEHAPKLRARARERVPRMFIWLSRFPGLRGRLGRRLLSAALHALERAIPRCPEIDEFIKSQAPDVALLTPLIGVVASPQLDLLASAKALGVPTALCVWSWDHLSSKALIRNVPDAVMVWNETQKREAIEMHRVPAERIVVTGAQCFDQWFDRQPARSRSEFCRRVGLTADRPFLLYVCSALFKGSPTEAGFVERWTTVLRGSADPAVRHAGILVRPHPSRATDWREVDLSRFENVSVWGSNPIDAEAKADYFDALYHSAAVVGLNTSAFLEAAIVGRPVYTILLPEFRENQEGTIHFHYLLTVAGGLLRVSRELAEHTAQLATLLSDDGPNEEDVRRSRRFVQAFIRPHGFERAATREFVETIERLRPQQGAPGDARLSEWALFRLFLGPLAAVANAGLGRRLLMDEREVFVAARNHRTALEKDRLKQQRLARKQEIRHDRDRRRAERLHEKQRRVSAWRRGKMKEKIRNMIKQRIGMA